MSEGPAGSSAGPGSGRRPARLAATIAARVLLGSLLLATTLLLAGSLIGPATAVEPTATPGEGGDPRSSGEGPGFVGEPLLAIGSVAVVGIGTVLATLVYVRLTERRRP